MSLCVWKGRGYYSLAVRDLNAGQQDCYKRTLPQYHTPRERETVREMRTEREREDESKEKKKGRARQVLYLIPRRAGRTFTP